MVWPWSSSACHIPVAVLSVAGLRCSRATDLRGHHSMPGCASNARTRRAGCTQPAFACQQAGVSCASPAACRVGALAAWLQSAPGLCSQPAGRPRFCSGRRSSTPQGFQSTPSCNNAFDCCSMARTPLRDTREKTLSSGERCGANRPTGSPEAPAAGASPMSSTCTCQPRRARLAAVAAPARPAPITRQRAGAARTGRVGGVREVRGSHRGSKVACRLSRLGGTPGTFSTWKPHCVSASRTARAMVQVARRVPRRQQRATALSVCRFHSSGLRCGLNPSR